MEPLERVLRHLGDGDLAERLAKLPGSDLTTVLLDVMRRRTGVIRPADVMQQRSGDRFVEPSSIPLTALHRTESLLLGALPDDIDTVTLSPLAPLGLHSSVAQVDQNRLVSTIRRTDVAGDPTAGLALEAARRRRTLLDTDPRTTEHVRLATVQRVVRAQTFEGPMSFAHFGLLGLVTAGRDSGSHFFEIESLADHAAILTGCLLAADADHVTVTFSDWTGGDLAAVPTIIQDELKGLPVTVLEDPDRTRARTYYLQGAFEIDVRFGGATFNAADGGLVDWTQQLLANRKERLAISGIGIDRVAIARTQFEQPQPDV